MKTSEETQMPQLERVLSHREPQEEAPWQLERSHKSPPELERRLMPQLKRSPWPQRERSPPDNTGECLPTTTGEETMDIAPREGSLFPK